MAGTGKGSCCLQIKSIFKTQPAQTRVHCVSPGRKRRSISNILPLSSLHYQNWRLCAWHPQTATVGIGLSRCLIFLLSTLPSIAPGAQTLYINTLAPGPLKVRGWSVAGPWTVVDVPFVLRMLQDCKWLPEKATLFICNFLFRLRDELSEVYERKGTGENHESFVK